MHQKAIHVAKVSSASASGPRDAKMKQSTVDEGPSQPPAKSKKRSWYMRAIEKILCMNVVVYKENYGAYKSRHAILTNQVQIMTALKFNPPKAPAPLVDYDKWHTKNITLTEEVLEGESEDEEEDENEIGRASCRERV